MDYKEEILEEEITTVTTEDLYDVVVFNDDINTFDHVTSILIKVCKHSQEQAEQCTYLIHFKGKCAVRSGSFTDLLPIKNGICDAGIDARII